MKSIMISESFTTTPVRATMPNIEISVRSMPISTWPPTAPTMPNGIADMTMAGCVYDLKSTASSTKIIISARMKPRCRLAIDSMRSCCWPSME